jgi:hypothetical protein
MVKASVNAQDTVSTVGVVLPRAIETSSLILGQFVTLRVQPTTYQRETGKTASPRADIFFLPRSVGGVRPSSAETKKGWLARHDTWGGGHAHLGPHTGNRGLSPWQATCCWNLMTLPVVSWRRARELFESSHVNKEYRS